jgi:hypothetical protein
MMVDPGHLSGFIEAIYRATLCCCDLDGLIRAMADAIGQPGIVIYTILQQISTPPRKKLL